jgi:DNA polymerase
MARAMKTPARAAGKITGRTDAASAAPFVPADDDLSVLRKAAASCRGCDLYKQATQTVFGHGPRRARVMLVGEQPGDQEDLQGAPFVGPAGEVLDRALDEAGLERDDVYMTNAVKHFKWEPRGKRRIHQKPRITEIRACRPWLEAEIRTVRPAVIVCLGSTAAQSLLGPEFRITKSRGQVIASSWAAAVLATFHPSAVLRADTPESREETFRSLTADLTLAAQHARP